MFTNFLPPNYQSPKASGNYMKFQDGENKIRILTFPILGWEDWQDKKPIRYTFDNKPNPIDPKKPVKHFWAFAVWNYLEEKIQILQITQATIRQAIEALTKDQDWGAPFFYDIKIIKEGNGVDTEYRVNPLPHKSLSEQAKEAFNEKRCNLNALFENADPFGLWDEYTKGIFEESDLGYSQTSLIKEQQLKEIMDLIGEDKDFEDSLLARLHKGLKINSFNEIPSSQFENVKSAILEHKTKKEKTA
jgi:hypothetical protein